MFELSSHCGIWQAATRRLPPPFSGNRIVASGRVGGLKFLFKPSAAWDPELLRIAAALVEPGDVVWDVGANVGLFAAAAASRAGPTGRVIAVEADEATAVLARANLGIDVMVGDAVDLLDDLASPDAAVFCDPARRTSSGRSWRVEDLRPSWSFVQHLLADRVCCVKLGPGLPLKHVPDSVAATWVSDAGDLVELSLWNRLWQPGREAVLLPDGHVLDEDGWRAPEAPTTPAVGEVLYEPDPAVIRAGLVDRLAGRLKAQRVHADIAYLVAAEPRDTPFATAFEVLQVLDAGERTLKGWVREQRVGTLEIKKRGVDIDPAALRRRLKPAGPNSATLVLTPTPDGARALVVRRL